MFGLSIGVTLLHTTPPRSARLTFPLTPGSEFAGRRSVTAAVHQPDFSATAISRSRTHCGADRRCTRPFSAQTPIWGKKKEEEEEEV